MLCDPEKRLVYVAVSAELVEELRQAWSDPVQVRLIGEDLTFRKLGQPVKGVYITDEDIVRE